MSHCRLCGFPIMYGSAAYAGLTCKCHLRSVDQSFDVLPANRRDSEEIATLRTKLAAAESRAERLAGLLRVAVRQNEHDMLMTGEELRACSAALAEREAG